MPVSRRIDATSLQKPPMAPVTLCPAGITSEAPASGPDATIPRARACSKVNVSPHIPPHLLGFEQPLGGKAAAEASNERINDEDICGRDGAPEVRCDEAAAELRHVRGFIRLGDGFCELRAIAGESTVVWQQSAVEATDEMVVEG